MQINWRKIKLMLFIWYAWSLMHLKSVWECFVFYSGLYLPLCVVDFVVKQYSLDRLNVDNGYETTRLQFFRIEYQILYHVKLRYDITSRALWFLHFVGNNYTDFINYAERVIPWYDIHSKKFNRDAEIAFKYMINESSVKMTLTCYNQYFWELYGVDPDKPPISYDMMFDMINFSAPQVSNSDEE